MISLFTFLFRLILAIFCAWISPSWFRAYPGLHAGACIHIMKSYCLKLLDTTLSEHHYWCDCKKWLLGKTYFKSTISHFKSTPCKLGQGWDSPRIAFSVCYSYHSFKLKSAIQNTQINWIEQYIYRRFLFRWPYKC